MHGADGWGWENEISHLARAVAAVNEHKFTFLPQGATLFIKLADVPTGQYGFDAVFGYRTGAAGMPNEPG